MIGLHGVPRRELALLGVALVTLVGCAGDASPARSAEAPNVAITREALVGTIPNASAPGGGLVRVYGSAGECSGQLLTRQWVITAAHCFCPADANTNASVSSSSVHVALGSESVNATLVQFHPQLDLALLRIEHMLPLRAPVQLWTGSSAGLLHKQVECEGFDGTAVAGGMPASALVRVTATHDALGSLASSCNGAASGGAVNGFAVALAGSDGDAGAAFDGFDAGAPCFIEIAGQRYLAGIVGGASNADPQSGWVSGIDGVQQWIRTTTDIWSAADCGADIPGTKFAVDPTIFVGAPNNTTLSLVAQHAYGGVGDSKLIVAQTSGTRFASWTQIPSPPTVDDMLAVTAGVDAQVGTQQGPMMMVYYLDDQRVLRGGLWYEPGSNTWVAPGFQPYPGTGTDVTHVRPRVGVDDSISFPLWIDDQGVVGGTMGIQTTYKTHRAINAFVDMPMPADAPVADASRRPTLIATPGSLNTVAGYRSLFGQFVIYRATMSCLADNDSLSLWCGSSPPGSMLGQEAMPLGQITAYDIPMADVRDIALGETIGTIETYWAISAGNDNELRLWLLDADGHARDFGLLGDRALGMVKPALYEPAPGYQSLLVAYTGENWSARVRPVGNCLGNTPPGW